MDKNTKSQLYHCWYSLKQRCTNPKCCSYKYYGAKGVSYDVKWETFDKFLEDMLPTYPGYSHLMSIDRIDSTKNYNKENCQWMPLSEQNKKHSNTVKITYKDKTMNIAEWEKVLGFKKGTLQARIRKNGWSIEKSIETPIRQTGIIINGEKILKKDLALNANITPDSLRNRLKKGLSLSCALDKNYAHKCMSEYALKRPRNSLGIFI